MIDPIADLLKRINDSADRYDPLIPADLVVELAEHLSDPQNKVSQEAWDQLTCEMLRVSMLREWVCGTLEWLKKKAT